MTTNKDRIVFTRYQGDAGECSMTSILLALNGQNETRLTMNPGSNGEYEDNAAPRYNRGKTMLSFVSAKNIVNRKFNIFFLDVAT